MSGFESKKAAANDKISITKEQLFEIVIKSLKNLTMQVEELKTRINRLEEKQRDDGK
jgi:hypothetical protein